MWKGYHLSIEGIRKGWKMVYKMERGWTSGGASPYKSLLSIPPDLLHVFWTFPRVWFIACLIVVFGMLLGDTLILDDLDCANKYRQQVSTLVDDAFQGDVTSDDSQQRFLALDSVATLLWHWFKWLQRCSNIAGNAVPRLAISCC